MTTYQISLPRATWINIVDPTLADVELLRQAYPYIHPLHLEDVLSRLERPKIDDDEQYIFVVLHFPYWDEDKRLSRPREVNFFVGRGYFVTVHDGSLKPLAQLFRQCQENADVLQRTLGKGASHAFYEVLDSLVDYAFPMLRKVDSNLRTIEESIFTADSRSIIRDIAMLRRDIISLRRIIRQQTPILENLERKERPIIHEELDEYFGDILDHLYKARDIIDENYELIAGLADTADSLISTRVNEVMRILTVISVIILPLTLISSIYGMNISLLPFADHPQSFWIVNGIMLVLAVAMLAYFRYRRWL
jgi:magnesium transporter